MDDCPICLEEIKEKSITICKHTFCKKCIDKWLETGYRCPICREELKPKPLDVKISLTSILLAFDDIELMVQNMFLQFEVEFIDNISPVMEFDISSYEPE